MLTINSVQVVNRLISGLPPIEYNHILGCCEQVELVLGSGLCEPNTPYQHVYFPLTGFISQVTTMDSHQSLEMGLIGNEGMLGVTLVLGCNNAPMRGMVQGEGTCLRMTANQLRREIRRSPLLHGILNHYLYVTMLQLGQLTACTHFHEVEQRLARFLLMAHDRAHSNYLYFTHHFLANVLGVRRSSVTVAAHALQEREIIRYTRGEICVLDRHKLEESSCACYNAEIDYYNQLLPVIEQQLIV